MSKKVLIPVLVLTFVCIGTVTGQDAITQLSTDMEMIFEELGQDVVPNLQTASILNHGLGSAELGDFPHMYFSLSVGATVAPGVLEFTRDAEKFENYDLFNNLLDEAGANDDDVRDITDNYAPYPSVRAGIGVGLVQGYEASFQAGVIPQMVTDMAGQDELAATITTLGARVRKVLVRQDRGVPAISAGLGYVYSSIDFSYDLSELDPIELSGNEGDPDYTTLAVQGEPTFKAQSHSFGFDVRASTRFIRVFYPFVGVTTYYQNTNYEAGVDGFQGALQVGKGTPTETTTTVKPAVTPFTESTFNDFNVVLNTGFDIKLWIFNLFAHFNYAVPTRAPGAILGTRLHF